MYLATAVILVIISLTNINSCSCRKGNQNDEIKGKSTNKGVLSGRMPTGPVITSGSIKTELKTKTTATTHKIPSLPTTYKKEPTNKTVTDFGIPKIPNKKHETNSKTNSSLPIYKKKFTATTKTDKIEKKTWVTEITENSFTIKNELGNIVDTCKKDSEYNRATIIVEEKTLENFLKSEFKIKEQVENDGYLLVYYKLNDGRSAIRLFYGNKCTDLFKMTYNDQKNITIFKAKNIIRTSNMFSGNGYIESIVFCKDFNTEKVIDMNSMFAGLINLKKIEGLNNFNTGKVTNMTMMFNLAKSLSELDLSSFNTDNVKDLDLFLNGCNKLKKVIINPNAKILIDNLKTSGFITKDNKTYTRV